MKRKRLIKNSVQEYRYGSIIEILPITSDSYCQGPQSYHYHNCWEIMIIWQGSLKYVVGNLPKEALPNDILVFGQNIPHGFIDFSKNIKGELLHISFDRLFLIADSMDASTLDGQFIEGLKFGYLFRSPMLASKSMALCKKMKKAKGFLKLSFLFQLLHHLAEYPISERLTSEQKISSTDTLPGDSSVERAFRFLYAHYQEDLTLDMIANYANQNASALCRSFKQASGYTLFQFINRLRIEKACSLLRNSSLNVTQIAYQVGFNSLTHFHIQFKKLTGTIPNEYKKLCLQSGDLL